MDAKTYFDSHAQGYDKERVSGPVGMLVTKERGNVLALLDPKKGEDILDAGCGSGYYSVILKEKGAKPFGVDFSEKMVKELKTKGIPGEVANLESFNLKKKFDKIVCGGALEFTTRPEAALKSMASHLKEGGTLVLVYPRKSLAGFAYRLFHRTHGVRIHLFTKKGMQTLLEQAGMEELKTVKSDPLTNVVLAEKK
ncbi:MAG: class I SAM-dependent methyltransferase [Nanoarchaeota archaeon]|nr:class I SAM-dependent methyltransferase [Nanoarchaeota archaeon]